MTHDTLEGRSVGIALIEGFARHLNSQQFLFVSGDALGDMLALTPEDIGGFAAHWLRLTLDRCMGDGGTYRFRRDGAFDAPPGSARRQLPHGPCDAPRYTNILNGDIARVVGPLEPTLASPTVLNRLLDWLTGLYDQCEGRARHWNIRRHPYRTPANQDEKGNPAPEGLRRDGVDYIVSMMIWRHNVTGGEATVTANDRQVLWQRGFKCHWTS